MRQLPPYRVFSRREAAASGWTDASLSRAAAAGKIVRVRRGFYSAKSPDHITAALAAARAVAGAAVADLSSLLVHTLPVVGHRPAKPQLTVPPDSTGDIRGVHLYRATMPPEHLTDVGGVPVLTPARTVVDVARHWPLATSVPAIDAALQRGLATEAEIEQVLLFCWNWPGIGRAQRAVRLSDGRAESPLESISRLVLDRLGLPVPDLQPLILDQFGRPLGRLDFYWEKYGIAGEADGHMKYDGPNGPAILAAEKERQEQLEDASMIFVRWGWEQATRRQLLLRERVMAAFARGAARDRSGIPRRWSVVPK
jgi:hypothetical protein